jgi:hypothetical protein
MLSHVSAHRYVLVESEKGKLRIHQVRDRYQDGNILAVPEERVEEVLHR